ncbi:MAG: hypothetical protein IT320_20830 [Anaerolineae bacterium]|nr:hypothetical protein [Anaerolineae bacterium]
MSYNQALTEQLAIVSTIDPQDAGTGDTSGDVIDMMKIRRVVFVLATGSMTSSSTVDLVVKGDTASGGSFTTTITGKAITQLTQAGSDGNKQVLLEVTAEEVAAQGFRYIKPVLTVAAAASQVCLIALASFLRYSGGADYDLASVAEIVN